jgi:Uncharacterised nucleotidyltransferase
MHESIDARRVMAARRLAIDAATVEMVTALRREGIRSLLLKGAAIAARLYDELGERPYGDFDLLVPPDRYADAAAVARRLGYRPELEGAAAQERGFHADTWTRPHASLDLHHRLFWFRGDTDALWDALASDSHRLTLAGTEVEVLSDPALALVIVAHRVHHGPADQVVRDLELALARFDRSIWEDARELARRLGMLQVLGVGLTQTPAGRTLASELKLPTEADLVMRMSLTRGKTDVIGGLLRLRAAGSTTAAARMVLREFIPTPTFMRHTWPFARRGPLALLLTYLYRPFKLAYHLPPALLRAGPAVKLPPIPRVGRNSEGGVRLVLRRPR